MNLRMALVALISITVFTAAACSDKAQPPTPTSTATATATATTTPPPTATATATPTSDPSADDLLYRLTILSESQKIQDSLGKFSTLTSAPNLTSPSWRSQIEAQVSLWRAVYAEANALVPPEKFKSFHVAYIAALGTLNDSANDLSDGISQLDSSLIQKAAGEITTFAAQAHVAEQLIPAD